MHRSSDRPALKAAARASVRAYAPKIFLVSIVLLVILVAPSMIEERSGFTFHVDLSRIKTPDELYEVFRQLGQHIQLHSGRYSLLALVSALLSLFQAVVQYSFRNYSLKISRGAQTGGLEELFSCFSDFLRYFLLNLLVEIFVFLWSMLLVIPGIIASCAYSQAPFLMMDHPELSPLQAIRESKRLMRGHKAEYFSLILSFLLWIIASAMTMNLLDIWLQPYMSVTFAHYYNALIRWAPAPIEPSQTPDTWWES